MAGQSGVLVTAANLKEDQSGDTCLHYKIPSQDKRMLLQDSDIARHALKLGHWPHIPCKLKGLSISGAPVRLLRLEAPPAGLETLECRPGVTIGRPYAKTIRSCYEAFTACSESEHGSSQSGLQTKQAHRSAAAMHRFCISS